MAGSAQSLFVGSSPFRSHFALPLLQLAFDSTLFFRLKYGLLFFHLQRVNFLWIRPIYAASFMQKSPSCSIAIGPSLSFIFNPCRLDRCFLLVSTLFNSSSSIQAVCLFVCFILFIYSPIPHDFGFWVVYTSDLIGCVWDVGGRDLGQGEFFGFEYRHLQFHMSLNELYAP